MTDAAQNTPIVTRPFDERTERAYVWSTAKRATGEFWGGPGGRWAHRPTIDGLVETILTRSALTIASYADDPSILGYVAWSPEHFVEFLYVNRAVRMVSRIEAKNLTEANGRYAAPEAEDLKRRTTVAVVRALLPNVRVVMFRRPPVRSVMEAILAAGYSPCVVPAGV